MEEKLKQAIEIIKETTKENVVIFTFMKDSWSFANFNDYAIPFGGNLNMRRLCSITKEKEPINPELGFLSLDECLDFIINYNETK